MSKSLTIAGVRTVHSLHKRHQAPHLSPCSQHGQKQLPVTFTLSILSLVMHNAAHRVHRVAITTFWRSFHHEGKINKGKIHFPLFSSSLTAYVLFDPAPALLVKCPVCVELTYTQKKFRNACYQVGFCTEDISSLAIQVL